MAAIRALKRGRPAKFDEPATDTIRVRVTPSQRQALRLVALESGAQIADIIREAVNEFVADYGERRIFYGHGRSRTNSRFAVQNKMVPAQ